MKAIRLPLGFCLAAVAVAAAAPDDSTERYSGPLDPRMGDYFGERVQRDGSTEPMAAQMVYYSDGKYSVRLAGSLDERDSFLAALDGRETDTERAVVFPQTMGPGSDQLVQITDRGLLVAASVWTGKLSDEGGLTGSFAGWENGSFALERRGFERYESPTLGEPPPPGATVLFAGRDLSRWVSTKPEAEAWEVIESEDALQVTPGSGDILSKEKFGSFHLHLEFRSPYAPAKTGQARGNSGVYLHGRYEIQILDSYGLEGVDNECGGVYQIARPLVNMCAPPTVWQTYDIDFTAAKFGPDGAKTADARMTVRHNGVVIHDDLRLPRPTAGSLEWNEVPEGPLRLQHHHNIVQFRNIWLVTNEE